MNIQENTNKRKRRTTLTKEILKSVRKSVERNYTIAKTAEEADISTTCANSLIIKIHAGVGDSEILDMKKGRKKCDSLVIKEKLRSILTRDPSSTLQSLQEDIRCENMVASTSTIFRCLKSMNYTRKRLSLVPQERNTEKTLDARQLYSRQVDSIPDKNLIFLDETGFNLHLTKRYGYSPVNSKCYVTVPANKNTNISLLMAININGILSHKIKEGAFNGEDLLSFLENDLAEHFRKKSNDVLIMDNCRFHHRSDVKQYLLDKGINFLYLPAYSPQLNPIEEYFSHIKAKYTSIRPLSKTKSDVKKKISKIISEENILFDGWFRHMRKWLAIGAARHHFE